ncbi:MAG: AAA family ATPase [Fibrobacteria bacterium]|nr:AAA family ATPase [Fibrobacteria bacterium]
MKEKSELHKLSSSELEVKVINYMLHGNHQADMIINMLCEDDFSDKYKTLFSDIVNLRNNNIYVDIVAITEQLTLGTLSDKNVWEKVINAFTADTSLQENIENYCEILKEKTGRQRVINTFSHVLEECHKGEKSISELKDLLIGSYNDIRLGQPIRPHASVDVLQDTFAMIEQYSRNERPSVLSGYKSLDKLTGGFRRGDLTVLAGNAGSGKTALAQNIVLNTVLNRENVVVYFSLESTKERVMERMLCANGGINLISLRNGKLQKNDYVKLLDAAGRLHKSKLFIDDSPGIVPVQLRDTCAKLKNEEGRLDLVIIDYLQLLSLSVEPSRAIPFILEFLYKMTLEYDVPVIVLSQLYGNNNETDDKKPGLLTLYPSRAFQQWTDVITFLYRPQPPDDEEKAEIIVAKNRNGPTGTVYLDFLQDSLRFKEPGKKPWE